MITVYSKSVDGNKQLSKNFKVREFACSDNSDIVLIDDKLITILQIVRNYFNTPVTIGSGYRTVQFNRTIDGATNSQHIYGKAADINVAGKTPQEVYNFLDKICADSYGLGIYSTWVHIDTRETKSRWKG